MKIHELEALRDLAIEFLPSAQRKREQAKQFGSSQDTYYRGLFLATMLTEWTSTSSAIERRAAKLLQQVMLVTLEQQYEGIENQIIETAEDLISLTGSAVPWFAQLRDRLPYTPVSPESCAPQDRQPKDKDTHEQQSDETQLSLVPGRLLTTKQAAQALNRKDQTLRNWASKQNGPVQPLKLNGQNMWRSDDILALIHKKR